MTGILIGNLFEPKSLGDIAQLLVLFAAAYVLGLIVWGRGK